ncbi:hypothetical protein TU82_02065 [Pseudomonas orientalis]|nr:hypothetical protein TU82_02065 [Pseudomonas orientalis]
MEALQHQTTSHLLADFLLHQLIFDNYIYSLPLDSYSPPVAGQFIATITTNKAVYISIIELAQCICINHKTPIKPFERIYI